MLIDVAIPADSAVCTLFVVSFSLAPQLSRDVPADAGFLCDKSDVFGDTIKGTLFSLLTTLY
jgi:hypothetical protein